MATVDDILKALEIIAPSALAEDWDNVGLQFGCRQWPVRKVVTALDPTPAVVQDVVRRNGNVLVTHHPLIFRPIRVLDLDTPLGGVLQELMVNNIAVISAHTNLDSVKGGVNDILATLLGIELMTVLQSSPDCEDCGLGRVGDLPAPTSLHDLAVAIKTRMAIPHVRCAGDAQLPVNRIAICSGSGSSLLEPFFASDAQVYITGDVGYHDAREFEARGRGLIDIGHFESEHIVLETLSRLVADQMTMQGMNVLVETCSIEQTPFTTI